MTLYINPYRRLNNLRTAMDRLFEETLAEPAANEREMALAVDVRGDDESFMVRAFVPGLDADDLEIEILNNTVTIRGEMKGAEDEKAKYMICELPTGRFGRVITLPAPVDSTKVEAGIKNGVLMLRLPKAEAHRPKAIKVTTG